VTTKLFCFLDTNLFIQCKPLAELDWSSLGKFDVVELLITRPVQKEIDAHKGKGNNRVASRARAASSLLKEVITADSGHKEVRARNPCVRLHIRLDLKPDPELGDALNYDEVDDQLVGIAAGFLKSQSSDCVRLVTGDVGPMASAKAANVPFTPIPDSWLLPPEEDATSKELKRVTEELARYRKSEPEFNLRWLVHGTYVERLSVTLPCYAPLTHSEIEALMEKIVLRFPVIMDFDKNKSKIDSDLTVARTLGVDIERIGSTLRALNSEVYVPATDAEITGYQSAYRDWLHGCEELLKNLHIHLAQNTSWPRLTIEIQNTGAKSANDVLVTLSAEGSLFIKPLKTSSEGKKTTPHLSPAPNAPKGEWRSQLDQLTRHFSVPINFKKIPGPLIPRIPKTPKEREHDSFYYKDPDSSKPVKQYRLECALWRHQSDPKLFELTLLTKLTPNNNLGAVEINLKATNLSSAFTKNLPIQITVKEEPLLERANALVNDLISD
jgi:hypothetical protein